jgi:hypothetical protein
MLKVISVIKRILALVIVLVVWLTFTACTNSAAPSSRTAPSPQSESTPPPSSNAISSSSASAEASSISEAPSSQSESETPPLSSAIPSSSESSISSEASSPSSSQSEAPPLIEPDATTVYIKLSNDAISLKQINNLFALPYTIYNDSSKEVGIGSTYAIEKYNESSTEWESFPFDEISAPNWTHEGESIPAGSTLESAMIYWDFEEEFTPGKYRFVQGFGSDGKFLGDIYAVFSVLE